MLRSVYLLTLALVVVLASTGCEQKKTAAQLRAEREKVWRADKKQRAAKYYQELIQKYPDSPFVAEAQQRLSQMGPVATPKPGPAAHH